MKPKAILWILLAVLIGEIALVMLTTIAQEVLFDGIDYYTSTHFDLIIGGLATFVASIIAGCVAALAIKNKNHWPHSIISLLIVAEMTYLVSTAKISDPLWFSFISGLYLIIGIWAGYFIMKRTSWKTSANTD